MGHFYYRGPLPNESRLYVGRQPELKQVTNLLAGPLRGYVTVVGANQVGKTSFLYRVQKQLGRHCPSALVNLQMIPDATPSGLFSYIASEMVKQLGLRGLVSSAMMVDSGPEFAHWLGDLPPNVAKAAILIDAIDNLPDKTAIYLANVLRGVFDDRHLPGSEGLARFVFLLAGGSELLNLTMTAVSPFSNIATRVHLPDLSLGEVRQLMAYGFSGTPVAVSFVDELAEAVYERTHGHPYLTQRLGDMLDRYAQKANSLPTLDSIPAACEELIHSDELVHQLRAELQDTALLHSAYQVQQHRTPFSVAHLRQEKLYLLGVIREENGVAVSGNAMYAEVVRQMAQEAGVAQAEVPSGRVSPGVAVKLLTPVIPTAFCHNLSARDFPWVQITIDNRRRGAAPAQVYVRASIEGFSDEAVSSLQVGEGESRELNLLPLLQLAACMKLNEIRPATLRVSLHQFGSGEEWLLHDQTYPIKLHAYDTALLGLCASDGRVVDLTDHLCAFVTPHIPEIEDLLRKAVEHHPLQHIVGYQGAESVDDARTVVREQVRAIFDALKHDAGLAYVNSALNFGRQEDQITQRVRLPVTSLHQSKSRANCIDGAVLYASLLELASLDPFLVIVPGHAFVGWRVWRGSTQYEFLETTMTATDEFGAALAEGNRQYADARDKGYFGRELFDRRGFARLVDVAACRSRDIYPLM